MSLVLFKRIVCAIFHKQPVPTPRIQRGGVDIAVCKCGLQIERHL